MVNQISKVVLVMIMAATVRHRTLMSTTTCTHTLGLSLWLLPVRTLSHIIPVHWKPAQCGTEPVGFPWRPLASSVREYAIYLLSETTQLGPCHCSQPIRMCGDSRHFAPLLELTRMKYATLYIRHGKRGTTCSLGHFRHQVRLPSQRLICLASHERRG